MGAHFKQGFTIIETMLVLAVTGVLIAGLLFGVGSSIASQRYSDSVMSFRSLLQDQFSQLNNVNNGRDAGTPCTASTSASTAGNSAPGQSDCVLLGRYISVVRGDVSMAAVVGYQISDNAAASDVEYIKNNYTLGISQSSIENKSLEWGAQISWPVTGSGARSPTTPRSIAILLLRSPVSGTPYTFSEDSAEPIGAVSSTALKDMLVESLATNPGQGSRTICVDPGSDVPEKFAIFMSAHASGANSIETRSSAVTAEMGGSSKC